MVLMATLDLSVFSTLKELQRVCVCVCECVCVCVCVCLRLRKVLKPNKKLDHMRVKCK